jgi:hypothetical protein
MFQSYDHLQVEIYLLENYSTDKGSVVFRTLVNIIDNYVIVIGLFDSWLLIDMVTVA